MNVNTNNNLLCTLACNTLLGVQDPEIGLSVIDLGLIYDLYFDEAERSLLCRMTLTTQFCPMGESITDSVRAALEGVFPDYRVEVQLTFDPPWQYGRISEEGKNFLKK